MNINVLFSNQLTFPPDKISTDILINKLQTKLQTFLHHKAWRKNRTDIKMYMTGFGCAKLSRLCAQPVGVVVTEAQDNSARAHAVSAYLYMEIGIQVPLLRNADQALGFNLLKNELKVKGSASISATTQFPFHENVSYLHSSCLSIYLSESSFSFLLNTRL